MREVLEKLIILLTGLNKNLKSSIVLALDISIIFLAWFVFVIFPAIFITKFEFTISDYIFQSYSLSYTLPLVLYLISMISMNGYREIFRSFSLDNIYPIFFSSVIYLFGMIMVNHLILEVSFFTSLLQSFSVSALSFLLILLSRISYKTFSSIKLKQKDIDVYLYGSGNAAKELFSSLSMNDDVNIQAFITDDFESVGRELFSTPIISLKKAKKIWQKNNNCSLYIASRSITDKRKREIIDLCALLGVRVQKISSYSDMIKEKEVSLIDLTISDVLPRTNLDEFGKELEKINDKSVLVTGAGGSIGAEICRILAKKGGIKKIILIDISEPALFAISEELKEINKKLRIISVLGSVKKTNLLINIIEKHKPEIVYHAAAYKHVPILENDLNYSQAFNNNFFGTCNIADVCMEKKVSKFILVSTDKAVRPTNFMGASKRMAELYLDSISQNSDTVFSSVRFGNVIDSSGSVIPTFRKQIKQGGPVTVTHPDIVRYFMTIGEAAFLVILASLIAKEPAVYMLKMGDPIKIDDLAKRLIKLSGNKINSDNKGEGIEIVYTGLRPGEKLYEELLVNEEDVKTNHPKIFIDTSRKKISAEEMIKIKNEIRSFIKHDNKIELKKLLSKYADYKES